MQEVNCHLHTGVEIYRLYWRVQANGLRAFDRTKTKIPLSKDIHFELRSSDLTRSCTGFDVLEPVLIHKTSQQKLHHSWKIEDHLEAVHLPP